MKMAYPNRLTIFNTGLNAGYNLYRVCHIINMSCYNMFHNWPIIPKFSYSTLDLEPNQFGEISRDF